MEKCIGCFKLARSPDACTECRYNQARVMLEEACSCLGASITEEEEEEIEYEIFCAIKGMEGERYAMEKSILARLISKSADAAVYLPKKRFVDLDDMKVILFDIERNAGYITNGDAVIRISNLPADALDGLRGDLPAYDYLLERFIPNPLPYDIETMDKVFDDTYKYAITLPIDYVLENIFRVYPEAIQRRGCLAVVDVGYGMYDASIIIPSFDMDNNGQRFHSVQGGAKIVVPGSSSLIGNEFIELDTSYVGEVTDISDTVITADIYKKFNSDVTLGMYRIIEGSFPDDIHPFNLELYSANDLIKFPLTAPDNFAGKKDVIDTYKSFTPMALELEYLYEILVLYKAFGFFFVNMYVNSPATPFLLEGITESEDQPVVEAVVATVDIGVDGHACESVLTMSGF